MKVLDNSLKLKALSKNHLLLIVVVIIIAAVFSVQIVNLIQKQPKDAYAILQKQRFVFIQNQDDLDQGNNAGAGFDLQAENLFVSYSTVIKNNKLYGKSGVYTTKEFYKRALNGGISSILLNLKVTPEEIEKHHFQIERDPESLVNKKFLKEKYPPEFEAIYLNKKRQFTKVRITYNKEFLPTKIEWYYKGPEGLKWYIWRTYSYPFKNKADFDKKLDEEIENIKEIQEENEGD
uniref:hypothetical protein n=1 Tax=uncultured Streptococcus sp. TaxID=83427 RepID=UPI0025D6B240|nr:hypothetical protein [uncultured Streptococcus sp.]